MSKKKIVFASQEEIRELRPWIDEVLKAIGHPEAWVSDKSMVCDFFLEEDELREVVVKLLVPVEDDDYLIDVARRLRDRVTRSEEPGR